MTRRKEKLIPPKVHEIADAENSAGSKDAEINQRPHEEFARDFAVKDVSERDLNFALNWEDALAQESELEIEMEKEFQTAESESWLSQMLQLSWGASPVNPSEENFGRLRVSKNMFEAMKLQDPFEAMHAGQSVTLHMHFNHIMRRASRAKDDQTAAVYYNLALKLGAAYTKTQESLTLPPKVPSILR